MFVYANKSESKYLGNIFGDYALSFNIIYKDNIKIPFISKQDFENCFNGDGIGILRDFNEYKNDIYSTPKKIISIQSSDQKQNTIIMDVKYKSIFGSTFKCLPVSTSIKSQIFINVYLSYDSKIKITRNNIIKQLHELLDGLVLSSYYNDLIFITENGIKAKIHSITSIGTVCDHTNFHLSNHTNIELSYNESVNIGSMAIKNEEKIKIEKLPDLVVEEYKPLSIDFSKLKVGGLKKQLEEIANVIRPRGIEQKHLDTIGMNEFERGIMLYGSPGTGKIVIIKKSQKIF